MCHPSGFFFNTAPTYLPNLPQTSQLPKHQRPPTHISYSSQTSKYVWMVMAHDHISFHIALRTVTSIFTVSPRFLACVFFRSYPLQERLTTIYVKFTKVTIRCKSYATCNNQCYASTPMVSKTCTVWYTSTRSLYRPMISEEGSTKPPTQWTNSETNHR